MLQRKSTTNSKTMPTPPPTPRDVRLARQSQKKLRLAKRSTKIRIVLEGTEDGERRFLAELPEQAVDSLERILDLLASGKGFVLLPRDAELTTRQAADMLNVSRPYLIRLLDAGKIPFHKTGTHRRINLEDLVQYKQEQAARREAAMAELAAQAQKLGLGYD